MTAMNVGGPSSAREYLDKRSLIIFQWFSKNKTTKLKTTPWLPFPINELVLSCSLNVRAQENNGNNEGIEKSTSSLKCKCCK